MYIFLLNSDCISKLWGGEGGWETEGREKRYSPTASVTAVACVSCDSRRVVSHAHWDTGDEMKRGAYHDGGRVHPERPGLGRVLPEDILEVLPKVCPHPISQ